MLFFLLFFFISTVASFELTQRNIWVSDLLLHLNNPAKATFGDSDGMLDDKTYHLRPRNAGKGVVACVA